MNKSSKNSISEDSYFLAKHLPFSIVIKSTKVLKEKCKKSEGEIGGIILFWGRNKMIESQD